jgi:hypothetical protein
MSVLWAGSHAGCGRLVGGISLVSFDCLIEGKQPARATEFSPL